MPVWRCPHCATPQAETSRCWVCRRVTTSCVTCRHYRRGVAAGLGLCGLDPAHPVVTETEVQPCWVAAPVPVEAPDERRPAWTPSGAGDWPGAASRVPRTFVPVEELVAAGVKVPEPAGPAVAALEHAAAEAALGAASAPVAVAVARVSLATAVVREPDRPVPGRWWLWGDPDPWPERR